MPCRPSNTEQTELRSPALRRQTEFELRGPGGPGPTSEGAECIHGIALAAD